MDELKIIPAIESDIPIILRFIKELASYEKLSHEVTATEESLKQNLFSEANSPEAVICYLGETPIGFALFFHNFSTFLGKKGLYLEDLFILPEYRGKGAGKKVLKYLANLAVERDCGRFEWAVLDWNNPAINFYESIGAELKKEWIITRLTGNSLIKLANNNKI